MDDVEAEGALIGKDGVTGNADAGMVVPSVMATMNGEEKVEHEIRDVSNGEITKEEVKNEGNDADSKTETSGLRSSTRLKGKAKNKKKIVAMKKKVAQIAKGASASLPELDEDGRVDNVGTEMVPSDPVKMNGEESVISVSMPDKSNITDDVATGVAVSDKNDIINNVDDGVATLKPMTMNGEEPNVVLGIDDKVEHQKDSVIVLGDEEKNKHATGELSNEESAGEEVSNEENDDNEESTKEEASNENSTKEEVKNENSTKEGVKNEGETRNEAKSEENSKKKATNLRRRKKKKIALRGKNELVSKNADKPESSNTKTMAKGTGMIFMCNSKTKMDCYQYKVLGLPASKRDTVLAINEGMRLFLFDVDLKLMYGIYKAAGPGGYNIEPKAFKSAFPSQVRFAVLEDCLPLAEEKFKSIIKDNYYSKNKFDCHLTSEQVNNLCKLFRVASKGSKFKQLNGSSRTEAPPPVVDHDSNRARSSQKAETGRFVDRNSKRLRRGPRAEAPPRSVDHDSKRPRPRAEAPPRSVGHDSKRPRPRAEAPPRFADRGTKRPRPRAEAAARFVDRGTKRPLRSRKPEASTLIDRKSKRLRRSPIAETQTLLYQGSSSRHHGWEEERRPAYATDRLYLEDPRMHRREVYASPLAHPPLLQPLPSARPHSLETDIYRRDRLQALEYHGLGQLNAEPRRRNEFEHRDPYVMAREQRPWYRDPLSSTGQPPEYYHAAASIRPALEYHSSGAPPPEYRPLQPVYRYYP